MIEYIHFRNVMLVEYNTTQNWYAQIPNQNWLCVHISDNTKRRYLEEVIAKIINKNICWISTVGKQSEILHDLVDEEIAFIEVDIDKPYLPQHHIITTCHTNFEEGTWFSIIVANSYEIDIETVILLDMTHVKRRKDIEMAITKVKNE